LQVFEQQAGYQKSGGLLLLPPNATHALAAIDPPLLHAAVATAVPDGRSIRHDHEGEGPIALRTLTWHPVPGVARSKGFLKRRHAKRRFAHINLREHITRETIRERSSVVFDGGDPREEQQYRLCVTGIVPTS
jgi:hypothetical protein